MVTQFRPGALFPGRAADAEAVRHAAWVARCVGRGDTAPLRPEDLAALASSLQTHRFPAGRVLFAAGSAPSGVWLVRSGAVELSVGSGRRRAVVAVLREGDVDGDIPLLLQMPFPYTARALEPVVALRLGPAEFEQLLSGSGSLARRWLTSVAARLAASQNRVVGLLGGALGVQVARLLLDEADTAGVVGLSQSTVADMVGARRPSVNKVLRDWADAGLVELGYRRIVIVDRPRLQQAAR